MQSSLNSTVSLREVIPRRHLRLGIIAALLVILTACSATTFVYNRLDFLLPWYLERYVDLDRDQARRLDEQLEPLLRWHRHDELPKYLVFLDEILEALDQPLTVDYVREQTAIAEDAWYLVRDRALDELLVLGEDLSDEQIEEFLESLDKRQRKYEDKYLTRSDEEAREDASDDLREFLEDYLGRLDSSQRQRVSEAALSLQRSDEVWLSERALWIDALRTELRREPGWQDRVRARIVNWERDLDPGSLALYEHNTLTVQRALVDVVNERSAKQDRRLRRKIQGLRDDVRVLMEQTADRN